MAASSATPVPYLSALFIKMLETTNKSYELSASRLMKYVSLSVNGVAISEWDQRGSFGEGWGLPYQALDPHRYARLLYTCTQTHITTNTHTHTHPYCRQLNFKTKLTTGLVH